MPDPDVTTNGRTFRRSEVIAELVGALAKAQGKNDRFTESILLRSALKPDRTKANTAMGRFFQKVVFGSSGCWLWIGSAHKLGYGLMNALGESKAHRVAWLLFHGSIPEGLHVLHRCDVRNCVNPEHIFLGSHTDNMRDMAAKGRGKSPDIRGERNPQSKLTIADVTEMRRLRALGLTFSQIAARFSVCPMTAHRAITGVSWNEAK